MAEQKENKKEQIIDSKLSVSEAIATRHSCREFLPNKPVSMDLINKILNQARFTPSSSNLQPWKIYIIHGQTKHKLFEIVKSKAQKGQMGDQPFPFQIAPGVNGFDTTNLKKQYPDLYAKHAAMGKLVYEAQGIDRSDRKGRMQHVMQNFNFFGAPIGLLFTLKTYMGKGQYPDLGILLGFIMLLCEQYGLSTCCQVAWAMWNKTLREELNIPDNEVVFCGMSIGYKNTESKVNQIKTARMETNEFVVIPQIKDHHDKVNNNN